MQIKPKCIDLFCGGGGATKGLQQAGFHVTGVDIEPQPRYCGDEFIQADALTVDLSGFDFVWASPPCEGYSKASASWRKRGMQFANLVPETRQKLVESGKPFIIENVVGAPLLNPAMLCGTMFGLKVFRHRLFESSHLLLTPFHPSHNEEIGKNGFVCVVGGNSNSNKKTAGKLADWQPAMEIDWMNRTEMTKAIPPAYSRFLAGQLLKKEINCQKAVAAL